LQLPYDVPANEFMNIEGKQFSKSRNWAIWLPDVLERYQPDAVRYYVARTFPESSDSDFSWEGFFQRVNNELLAAWGNLVNRVLGFAYKRFDGKVPVCGELPERDRAIIAEVQQGFETIGALLEQVKLRGALQEAMTLTQNVNAWLAEREPWKAYKNNPEDAACSVYAALQCINDLKTLFAPFLPFSSQQVHAFLGFDGQLFGDLVIEEYHEEHRSHKGLVYKPEKQSGVWAAQELPQGQALREPQALFVKLDETVIEQERSLLGQPRVENPITL
jgi:methionyl-tRNA synthetase